MSQDESPVPPDPILTKSYSVHIAIAMLATVAALVLVVADEVWLRRPYKRYQAQWKEVYGTYLGTLEVTRKKVDDTVRSLDEFNALTAEVTAAESAAAGEAGRLESEIRSVTAQARSLGIALKTPNSEISALTYQADHQAQAEGQPDVATAEAAAEELAEIRRIREREIEYEWQAADGTRQTAKGRVGDLVQFALDLEVQKATLQQSLAKVTRESAEKRRKRDKWLAANLESVARVIDSATDEEQTAIAAKVAEVGIAKYLDHHVVAVSPGVVANLIAKNEAMTTGIMGGDLRQVHIAEANNWVDRCEACHMGTREPLTLTVEGMRTALASAGWPESKIAATPLPLFTSHPRKELLDSHDPERFGCSMCHNGNGVAVTSVVAAHGQNKHWMQPLFPRENLEAGCLQCHQQDLVLPMGDRITAGKDSFRRNGCWGCHRYEGFDTERDLLTQIDNREKDIDAAIDERQRKFANLQELFNVVEDDDAFTKREGAEKKRRQDALNQEIAGLRTERDALARSRRGAYVERQRVGPNLKDLKVKMRPEFLSDWLRNPSQAHKDAQGKPFRPDTKMPTPAWANDEEPKDVAAFLWQRALDPSKFEGYRLPQSPPGDAAAGEELFKTVGCLACHSIGEGATFTGSRYAANLSNLGEKNRYEYVIRWISDPRTRLTPYSPSKKMDVSDAEATADDVRTQHTIMPDLRLSEKEARDIATYLVSQKRTGVAYPSAPWLEDESRVEKGRKLVLYMGCAGCHEIQGLEDEKGIGTELTVEGSKPLERLDFGHLTISAVRGQEPLADWTAPEDGAKPFEKGGKWYRPRGFFMHKLAKPDVFDTSKYLPDRFLRLRMPQFKWSGQELHDLTTFLMGSVEPQVPETFRYSPGPEGEAIREGWWVVRKYNCEGCHQIQPGHVPALHLVPQFAAWIASDMKERYLPPSLVGTGLRTQPDWLAAFLTDPSMGGGSANPKYARPYLPVRMPTFSMSPAEVEKLVRFFDALAQQPSVYQRPAVAPLDAAERRAAEAVFNDANCAKCHVVEGMPTSTETKAPKLDLASRRLKPEWMARWIRSPLEMHPGTAMPALFKEGADGLWRYTNPNLPGLEGYKGDQVDLMVRYLYSLSDRQ